MHVSTKVHVTSYPLPNLGLQPRLEHDKGNGPKEHPRIQAHSHKSIKVNINSRKWIPTLVHLGVGILQCHKFLEQGLGD